VPRTRLSFLLVAIAVLLTLSGCSHADIRFVDDGGSYTQASATDLLESADPGELVNERADAAPRLRQEALSRLRDLGGTAETAASVITRSFPSDSTGVPYRVERATFDGDAAWIILEARGRANGPLSGRLLWVIDRNGTVLYSGMR